MTARRAWLLVGFLGVALFLNNVDRHSIFAIFPVLKAQLNLSDVELGLTGSLFLWVYALANPVAGQIGDRFSKRVLVVLSLVLWSGVTIITGSARSAFTLLVSRALLGITESLFMPSAMALLASAHGPGSRSLATNIFGLGEYVGVAVGGWYGSYMAQEFNWRMVFHSLGLAGIIYAIPCATFLRRTGPWVSDETTRSRGGLSIARLARVPSYRFLCIVFPVCVSAVWLLYTWFPSFLYEKFSLSLAEAGFTATVYLQSANLIGSLSGAALADWLYRRTRASRFWVACAGFFLAAPCLYAIGNSSSLFLTKLAAVGFGLAAGMFLANLLVSSFDVVPMETRASACGCLNLTGSMVSGFASLFEGKWKESVGLTNMMSYAALACVGAGLLLVITIRVYFENDHRQVRQMESNQVRKALTIPD